MGNVLNLRVYHSYGGFFRKLEQARNEERVREVEKRVNGYEFRW